MNFFYLILAMIILLYLIKTLKSYQKKNLFITILLVLCGIFDFVLFLCSFLLEDWMIQSLICFTFLIIEFGLLIFFLFIGKNYKYAKVHIFNFAILLMVLLLINIRS